MPSSPRTMIVTAIMTAMLMLLPSSLIAQDNADTEVPSGSSKAEQHSAALNERGSAAAQGGQLDSAQNLFKQALEVNPRNITAAYNLASVYLSQKKEQDAIDILERYTQEYPDDAGLFARLGDAYFSSKNVKSAARAYESALKIDPEFPNVAERLGNVYGLDDQLGKAIDMYLRAVEGQPRNAQLLSNLSNLFLANGQADKAVSTAKSALQVQASKDTYLTLGSAYESMDDLRNALIAYERARDLGDQSKELEDRIRTIKRLSKQQE